MTVLTIHLPEGLDVARLVREAAERAAQQAGAELPRPNPQYSVPKAAELLGVEAATVRQYLRLPTGHVRRLRYVDTTGTPHGWRIPLSELTDWQQRNLHQRPEEVAPLLTRPALRKAA